MTREEQEQEMLQALELLKQVDPERYQALLTEMAAAVNPGGGLEKRFDWRCGLSPHTCLALTSLPAIHANRTNEWMRQLAAWVCGSRAQP